MATLKNPSIYDDRSTIGSADELDEYGVWVKIEPEELSEAGEDRFPDFDADFISELPQTEAEDLGLEDFDYSGEGEGFDDVEALRQDIEAFPPDEPVEGFMEEPAAHPAEQFLPRQDLPGQDLSRQDLSGQATAELSTQLLVKIVDALSAIKDELSVIQGDIAALRSGKPARDAETEDTGFFGEEEDDKIALTGDELDNIIQTAAFTEETGVPLEDDFATEEALEPPPGEDIFDGLGRPLQTAAPEVIDEEASGPATVSEEAGPDYGEEIIYDGLGRPLNRKISGDTTGGEENISLGADEDEAIQTLRENGVEPMTIAPEDTSYLEEDPLVEEDLDLPSIIEEQDLDDMGDTDTPSPEELSLIDLENLAPPPVMEEEGEEKPLFEDVSFEDLPDLDAPLDSEDMMSLENPDEEETIDLSVFEDDFLPTENNAPAEGLEGAGELSFEVLGEDTDLPVQENIQDNVITEDSFESISLEDDGELADLTLDKDLEQTLPGDIDIDLDFPLMDEEITQDPGEEERNFDQPGSAAAADAGDPTISSEEVPPAIRLELRDVLIYMDKLLEALPEEKINEFAQSEHYTTYKQLFEELGIQQ